jgi:AbrB family looped-hinge helix DNA binding protein
MQQTQDQNQTDWLKVLSRGMVTIPKKWRDELQIKPGQIVKAKKQGQKIIIEPKDKPAPYRIYSKEELTDFVARDALPEDLQKKIDNRLEHD